MNWFENQIIRFIHIRFSEKAVYVVFVVLVGSHSSELRIDHRLFYWIPDFLRKVLNFFLNLFSIIWTDW